MRWWDRLTLRGRTMLMGGLLASMVATGLNQRDVLWVTLFITLLPLGALILSSTGRIAMTCIRQVTPERTQIGVPATVRLDIEMRSRFLPTLLQFEDTVDPRLGSRPEFDSHRVTGRWRRQVSYQLSAHTRGVFEAGPFLVHSTDPFGLARIDRAFQTRNEVVVTPQVYDLTPIKLGAGVGTRGDETPHRIGTNGHDDVLVREHRHGDDLRRVHWRSTAKYGELMVRREEQSLDPSVTILLDSREQAYQGSSGAERFEWAVSATASMAHHLIRRGYRVRIVDADGPRAAPRHDDATANWDDVLMAMTTQQVSRRATLEHALAHPNNGFGGQTLIVVLGDTNDTDAAQVLASRTPGQRGWVFLLGERPTDELARVFAAQQWRVQMVPSTMSVSSAWAEMGGLI